jgi:hypothetical protein
MADHVAATPETTSREESTIAPSHARNGSGGTVAKKSESKELDDGNKFQKAISVWRGTSISPSESITAPEIDW